MNLMKWMRKNKPKIMAIVVVLIMIAFTVPTLISQWQRPGIKGDKPIAHYYNKKGAISNDDIRNAQNELSILRMIGAEMFLQSRPSLMQTADIPSLALSQVLFNESRISPFVAEEIKKIARQQQLRLADWQVDDFYNQQSKEKPEILWLLLKAEAKEAGIAVSNQEAGAILKAIVPQMPQMKGATAEQLLKSIIERQGIDQDTILRAFADLIAVMNYANTVTQSGDVTAAQIKYETLRQGQSMDIEAVIFDASAFAKKAASPGAESIQKQFNAYKAFVPFDVTAENPYGFGYKQPPRVEVEWMLIERTEVAKQVPVPTSEQTEEYYQRNQSQFVEQVLSDPNDPNSAKVDKLKSYADVAAQISKQLLETRIAERAENILLAARETADANLALANIENLSAEQMQKLAVDYKTAAENAGKKFGIAVHCGKTGLITPEDMMRNEILGRLFMIGQDRARVSLVNMAFAIDELKASRLGPFAPAKPRIFESIGPLNDYMQKVVAIVRVVGAEKAGEPCGVDITYAKKLPVMKGGAYAEGNEVFILKDKVAEDLKKLDAMAIAKQAAESLLTAVPKEGWEKAVAAVNKQYGEAPSEANKTADTFKLQPLQGLRRISEQEVKMMTARAAYDPVQSIYVKRYQQQKQLIDQFYSLLEPEKTVATNVPLIVEFKPEMTYYVIKSMSRTAVDPNTYQQLKSRIALMQDYVHGQSLGFEHFKADNIIRRMKFEWDEKARAMPVKQEIPPSEDVI